MSMNNFREQKNASFVQLTFGGHTLKRIDTILILLQQCSTRSTNTILLVHDHVSVDKGTVGFIAEDSCQVPLMCQKGILHPHDVTPIEY